MVLYKSTDRKLNIESCILALGNFDGVHLAHKELLVKAREYAAENKLLFGIYTFENHSRFASGLLNLNQEKCELFQASNADFVYFEDFCSVKNVIPEDFVDLLIKKFNCICTVCGENFRFGKNAAGNSAELYELMNAKGLDAITVPTLTVESLAVSSTRIRELIKCGEIIEANELLGYKYGFSSVVIHGANLGHKLGFPTINQPIPIEKVCPKYGVYASIVSVDDKIMYGVTNIGVKPTVNKTDEPFVETHIIGFSGDVYGKNASIRLCKMLRSEKHFASLDELIKNINHDVAETKEFFGVK